jgi:GNAT superfamily N-acetyltransferase
MSLKITAASFGDLWWAAGRDMVFLPEVDPAFAPQNMSLLRRWLLRLVVLPLSYRRSDFARIAHQGDLRQGYLIARQRGINLHLNALGVEPAFRRQGVATQLLSAAEQYAHQAELVYVSAALTPQNTPAIKFFLHHRYAPYRQFRLEFSGSSLPAAEGGRFGLHELPPLETLPAYDEWQKIALTAARPLDIELLLGDYLRQNWKAAARHFLCLDAGQARGYLRLAGLGGRYHAYLAAHPQVWESPAQVAWLRQAVELYAAPLQQLTLDLPEDATLDAGWPIWQSAGFERHPRPRFLWLKRLASTSQP